IEIVRDAAGQPADTFQPLGLHQLRLKALTIGDIAANCHTIAAALLHDCAYLGLDPTPGAAGVAEAICGLHPSSNRDAPKLFHNRSYIIGMDEAGALRAEQIFWAVAQHSPVGWAGIAPLASVVEVKQADQVAGVLGDQPVELFALAQRGLDPPALGD